MLAGGPLASAILCQFFAIPEHFASLRGPPWTPSSAWTSSTPSLDRLIWRVATLRCGEAAGRWNRTTAAATRSPCQLGRNANSPVHFASLRGSPWTPSSSRTPSTPSPATYVTVHSVTVSEELTRGFYAREAKMASAISAKPAPRGAQERYRGGTERRGRLAATLLTPKLVVKAKKQGASLALSPMYA
jgi:hypothetical protein